MLVTLHDFSNKCFFFQLGTYSQRLILLILCLTTSTSYQWCISDEYKTYSKQSCHNIFCCLLYMTYQVMVFFFQLGIYMCRWIFINFMPMIILIILKFSNLVALAFDQWCIYNDFGTSANQFLLWPKFCLFFLKGFIKDFFLSPYAKKLHLFMASHISIPWYSYIEWKL